MRGTPNATYKEQTRISRKRSASKLPLGLKLSTKMGYLAERVSPSHLMKYLPAYIDRGVID